MERVAVLGLGMMGSALARALQQAGRPLTVWNRSPERCAAFGDDGVDAAASVLDAVAISDVIVVCVHDYAAANAALRDPAVAAALAGKTIVQLSSGTPFEARDTAEWARGNGIGYVDGVIMAFPRDIATPSAVVLHSGPSAIYEPVAGIVSDFGGTAAHVGDDVVIASAIDNGILSIYYGFLLGVINGAGICSSFDVPLAALNEIVAGPMPTLASVMERTLDMAASGDYTTDQSTVDTTVGALGHIAAVSDEAGLDLRFITCAQQYAARAVALGHGRHNPAAMFEVVRSPSDETER